MTYLEIMQEWKQFWTGQNIKAESHDQTTTEERTEVDPDETLLLHLYM